MTVYEILKQNAKAIYMEERVKRYLRTVEGDSNAIKENTK